MATLIGLDVTVKHHGHTPHKEPPGGRDLNARLAQLNQALGLQVFKEEQLFGKPCFEIHHPRQIDGFKLEMPLTHQGHDDRAANQVVA